MAEKFNELKSIVSQIYNELLDNDGELIETPFNPSSRIVVLE